MVSSTSFCRTTFLLLQVSSSFRRLSSIRCHTGQILCSSSVVFFLFTVKFFRLLIILCLAFVMHFWPSQYIFSSQCRTFSPLLEHFPDIKFLCLFDFTIPDLTGRNVTNIFHTLVWKVELKFPAFHFAFKFIHRSVSAPIFTISKDSLFFLHDIQNLPSCLDCEVCLKSQRLYFFFIL